jgi:hypothetical protein
MGGIAIDVLSDEDGELQEGGAAIVGAHIEEVNCILEGLSEELERHSKGKKAAEVGMEVLRAMRRDIESRHCAELDGGAEAASGSGAMATGAATKVTDESIAGEDGDVKQRAAAAISKHLEDADRTLKDLKDELARHSEEVQILNERVNEVRASKDELISLRLKDGEEVDEHGVLVMQQEPLTALKVVEAKLRTCARRRNNAARFHLISGEVTKGSGPSQAEQQDEVVGGAAAFHIPANEGNVTIVMNPTHGSFGIEGVQMQAGLAMEVGTEGAAAARSATRPATFWPTRAFTRPAATAAASVPPASPASSMLRETNNAMLRAGGENTL